MSGRRFCAAQAALIGKRNVDRIGVSGPHTRADPIVCIKLNSCSVIIASQTTVGDTTGMVHVIFTDQIRLIFHGDRTDCMPVFIVRRPLNSNFLRANLFHGSDAGYIKPCLKSCFRCHIEISAAGAKIVTRSGILGICRLCRNRQQHRQCKHKNQIFGKPFNWSFLRSVY